eukprot:Filipodium_phascolosomae@DN1758_c0_g1_i1.p1
MLRVCGGDNLVHFDFEHNPKHRYRLGKEVLEYIRQKGRKWYGMTMSDKKSRVTIDPYVKYTVPNIWKKLPDHSRKYLKHKGAQRNRGMSHKKGVGIQQYRILREWWEVEKAMDNYSKRWAYKFDEAARYLNLYYTEYGMPIRPKTDLITRLGITPVRIKDVYQWRALLMQYLLLGYTNMSSRFELMSMLIDSYYMEDKGIKTFDDAFCDAGTLLTGKSGNKVRKYIMTHFG